MRDKLGFEWMMKGLLGIMFVAAFLGMASAALGDARIWNGSVNTDWFTAANWTPSGIPGNGDAIVIDASAAPATNVVVSNATASLGSFAITNAVLTFTNWTTKLNATNVTIGSGGVFTLPGAFASGAMSNRVYVSCTNFSMMAGGGIYADGKGYLGTNGVGSGTFNTDSGAGGSHGGVGGRGYRPAGGYPGATYGVTNAPLAPGSGGGCTNVTFGGSGGGAVRIEAPGGTVTVNGFISANGATGVTSSVGGGSGGSIYITCGTFSGSTSGVLRANGGNGGVNSGGGGGGRIAVQYDSLANSAGIQFSASPGTGTTWTADQWWMKSAKGTLYLSDATLLSQTLTSNLFTDVRLYGFTSWTVNSLTVSNCAVDLAESGFQLTVNNNITIATNGALGVGGELGASLVSLKCGGSIILTNGGSLSVYGGFTNGTPDYGGLVSVTNDMVIGVKSWIYPYSHSTNGGSVLFRMRDLLTATNCGFNAIGRGYTTSQGPGKGGAHASRSAGGGYGGKGGDNNSGTSGGLPYGSTNAPIQPGSGSTTYNLGGGRGGGSVRIEAARRIALYGTITAKGGGDFGGGGSGGGIYVQCEALEGTGVFNADGGNGVAGVHGGGGGGRIALVVTTDSLTGLTPTTNIEYSGSANGRISVDGGPVGYQAGTNGTFVLQYVVARSRGTLLIIR
jgi:hypothetical protein